jgi:hypothetical protein
MRIAEPISCTGAIPAAILMAQSLSATVPRTLDRANLTIADIASTWICQPCGVWCQKTFQATLQSRTLRGRAG